MLQYFDLLFNVRPQWVNNLSNCMTDILLSLLLLLLLLLCYLTLLQYLQKEPLYAGYYETRYMLVIMKHVSSTLLNAQYKAN